jgi:hypothetical protein
VKGRDDLQSIDGDINIYRGKTHQQKRRHTMGGLGKRQLVGDNHLRLHVRSMLFWHGI